MLITEMTNKLIQRGAIRTSSEYTEQYTLAKNDWMISFINGKILCSLSLLQSGKPTIKYASRSAHQPKVEICVDKDYDEGLIPEDFLSLFDELSRDLSLLEVGPTRDKFSKIIY